MLNKFMKRGILVIAAGHINYLRMAINLAASIKCNEPALPVALAYNGPVVDAFKGKLFDEVISIPEEYYTQNGSAEFIKSKLFMYDLSPFDETIFLDADQIMIMGRKLQPVFDEMKKVDVTFSNTGHATESVWADIAEVKKLYGNKPYWNYHSEFVFFRKSNKAKSFFDAAKQVYEDNIITSATRFSAATMADELAFQVAGMITGIQPHKENWLPNFWFDHDRREMHKYPYQLKDKITYSIGGKYVPAVVKTNYNNLAKHYFATLGLSRPYQVVDKKDFLPERKMI